MPAGGASAMPPVLWILRVRVRDTSEVRQLVSSGLDVLEARGRDYLLALGDEAAVRRLRAQGFVVEVETDLAAGMRRAPQLFGDGYRTVAEHVQHLNDIATVNPDLAVVVDYGDSWRKASRQPDGHDLIAICLTRRRPGDCSLNPETDKPRFLLMAAIHARELSTSEMAWRWIDELIAGYGAHPDITWLLDSSELWVVPVANPDGRRIVETTNLFHRKNANASFCPGASLGVDLNRNASFEWGGAGTSPNPCDENFLGPSPASEPEQAALEALMRQLFRDQRGPSLTDPAPITASGSMLTLHSFSDLVLLPWGWTECSGTACPSGQRAPNDAALRSLAFRMTYYNGYSAGQASELLYAASGSTDDWAYGVLGVPGFTFEIGPAGGDCGYFNPPYACQDDLFWPLNREAFLYAAKVARQPYSIALGPTTLSVTLGLSGTSTMISAIVDDGSYGLLGFGRPAAQAISRAEYTVDIPPWAGGAPTAMAAADGSYDSSAERVAGALDTRRIGPGRHMIFVRAQDAGGNWGPVTAMWYGTLLLPHVFR